MAYKSFVVYIIRVRLYANRIQIEIYEQQKN